jgi:hypothetical protein
MEEICGCKKERGRCVARGKSEPMSLVAERERGSPDCDFILKSVANELIVNSDLTATIAGSFFTKTILV